MTRLPPPGFSLYGRDGRRKYLRPAERARFIAAARDWPRPEIGTLCLVLAFTGCRISEALALPGAAFDLEDGFVAIRTLKKRGLFVVREIPLPEDLMTLLRAVHGAALSHPQGRLWVVQRCRAWQLVKEVMAEAEILPGPHCTPKGLRHGFGVHAVRSGVPLNLVQRWLGHASLATTAIYTDVLGEEEREIARRMWREPSPTIAAEHAAAGDQSFGR